ncbi:MAG TPA: OB-fold domain-containing protein [Acidimicrobiales bacterium]
MPPFRVLPLVDDRTRPFWTGGADGALRFWRCRACGCWLHPPGPRCPRCLSKDLAVAEASGDAVVHTFTVNHQPWIPGLDPPYVVAVVELPEQPGLRLTTALVGVEPDDVAIGLPVHVTFERHEDVWIPLFAPAGVGEHAAP